MTHRPLPALARQCLRLWAACRRIAGDDAYERYLAHWQRAHGAGAPLDRRAFYLAEQRRKWDGVRRCC
jgi:uncharacterized short protein YbdD (DUF466 family)